MDKQMKTSDKGLYRALNRARSSIDTMRPYSDQVDQDNIALSLDALKKFIYFCQNSDEETWKNVRTCFLKLEVSTKHLQKVGNPPFLRDMQRVKNVVCANYHWRYVPPEAVQQEVACLVDALEMYVSTPKEVKSGVSSVHNPSSTLSERSSNNVTSLYRLVHRAKILVLDEGSKKKFPCAEVNHFLSKFSSAIELYTSYCQSGLKDYYKRALFSMADLNNCSNENQSEPVTELLKLVKKITSVIFFSLSGYHIPPKAVVDEMISLYLTLNMMKMYVRLSMSTDNSYSNFNSRPNDVESLPMTSTEFKHALDNFCHEQVGMSSKTLNNATQITHEHVSSLVNDKSTKQIKKEIRSNMMTKKRISKMLKSKLGTKSVEFKPAPDLEHFSHYTINNIEKLLEESFMELDPGEKIQLAVRNSIETLDRYTLFFSSRLRGDWKQARQKCCILKSCDLKKVSPEEGYLLMLLKEIFIKKKFYLPSEVLRKRLCTLKTTLEKWLRQWNKEDVSSLVNDKSTKQKLHIEKEIRSNMMTMERKSKMPKIKLKMLKSKSPPKYAKFKPAPDLEYFCHYTINNIEKLLKESFMELDPSEKIQIAVRNSIETLDRYTLFFSSRLRGDWKQARQKCILKSCDLKEVSPEEGYLLIQLKEIMFIKKKFYLPSEVLRRRLCTLKTRLEEWLCQLNLEDRDLIHLTNVKDGVVEYSEMSSNKQLIFCNEIGSTGKVFEKCSTSLEKASGGKLQSDIYVTSKMVPNARDSLITEAPVQKKKDQVEICSKSLNNATQIMHEHVSILVNDKSTKEKIHIEKEIPSNMMIKKRKSKKRKNKIDIQGTDNHVPNLTNDESTGQNSSTMKKTPAKMTFCKKVILKSYKMLPET